MDQETDSRVIATTTGLHTFTFPFSTSASEGDQLVMPDGRVYVWSESALAWRELD
jgi:hypothetical protein